MLGAVRNEPCDQHQTDLESSVSDVTDHKGCDSVPLGHTLPVTDLMCVAGVCVCRVFYSLNLFSNISLTLLNL